jgi:hypothetical protein
MGLEPILKDLQSFTLTNYVIKPKTVKEKTENKTLLLEVLFF